MTTAKVTQSVARTVSDADPNAKVTQVSARSVSDATPAALVTQMSIRVVSRVNTPQPRVMVIN